MAGTEQFQHDPEDPEAETVLLERVAEGADAGRLRELMVGQVVSTGDRFAGFEVIEIVPPDEPALIRDDTTFEFV